MDSAVRSQKKRAERFPLFMNRSGVGPMTDALTNPLAVVECGGNPEGFRGGRRFGEGPGSPGRP